MSWCRWLWLLGLLGGLGVGGTATAQVVARGSETFPVGGFRLLSPAGAPDAALCSVTRAGLVSAGDASTTLYMCDGAAWQLVGGGVVGAADVTVDASGWTTLSALLTDLQSALDDIDGELGGIISAAGALSGTSAVAFTINNGATALIPSGAKLVINAATGAVVLPVTIEATALGAVALYVDIPGLSVSGTVTIGPPGDFSAGSNIDQTLRLRGHKTADPVGTATIASVAVDASADQLILTPPTGGAVTIGPLGDFSAGSDVDQSLALRGHKAGDAVGVGTQATVSVDASADQLVLTPPSGGGTVIAAGDLILTAPGALTDGVALSELHATLTTGETGAAAVTAEDAGVVHLVGPLLTVQAFLDAIDGALDALDGAVASAQGDATQALADAATAQGVADAAIPQSLATVAEQLVYSTGLGLWAATSAISEGVILGRPPGGSVGALTPAQARTASGLDATTSGGGAALIGADATGRTIALGAEVDAQLDAVDTALVTVTGRATGVYHPLPLVVTPVSGTPSCTSLYRDATTGAVVVRCTGGGDADAVRVGGCHTIEGGSAWATDGVSINYQLSDGGDNNLVKIQVYDGDDTGTPCYAVDAGGTSVSWVPRSVSGADLATATCAFAGETCVEAYITLDTADTVIVGLYSMAVE